MARSETAAGAETRIDDTTARQLLESQSEASLDGILVVSSAGEITSYNRRFAELWNLPDDLLARGAHQEALAHAARQLAHPDAFLARVAHLYDHPDEHGRDELRLKDGRIIERYSAPVRDVDGRTTGRVSFFRDVTEQRRAEAELERRVSELDGLARMADSLVRAETLDGILGRALDTLTEVLGVDRAAVLLYDDAGVMRFRAWRGLSDGYRAVAEGHSPWPPDAVDPQPLVVDDVEGDPELEELRPAILGEGIRCLAFVPLVHGRRLLGKFMLYAPAPGAFAARELGIATTIASQIAAAAARSQVETELRGSRDQLAVILREVADGITVQDHAGRVVFANDAAARLIGFDAVDELLATPIAEILTRFELLDEERRPFALERLPGRRALQGESAEAVVCYRVRATGDERWSIVRATPVRAEDGRVQFAINVFHDISERKRAEDRIAFLAEASKLLASSLEYETTLARISELAVPKLADWAVVDMLDADGSLRRLAASHVDPEKASVLHGVPPPRGYRRIVAFGEPLLLSEIDDERLRAAARDDEHFRQIEQLEPCALICVPLVSRGRTLGAITLASTRSSRPYGAEELDFARELASRAALAVDNALLYRESQAAARRLEESFALLNALLASAPVGVGFWDRDLRYVRVNETLAELNGVPADEHVGRTLHEVVPELAAELEPLYRRVLETGVAYEHQESTGADANRRGDDRHWLSSYYPVKTADGEVIGVGAVITEITERRRAERERAARARQQAAVAALGQLALADSPLEQLLDAAVRRVADTLGAEYAKVLELTPEGSALALRAGVGWRDGLVGSATVPLADSQAGFTLRSEEPVVVADLRTEDRFRGPSLLHEHGVVSGVSVVVEGRTGPFGVLGAHTRELRTFNADDANFMRSVANVLAAAIERRRADREREELLEAEQRARREAERSAELLGRLHSVTEATLAHLRLEDLLQELLGRVADLLNTDTAAVLLLEHDRGELVAWAAKGLEEEVERGVRIPLGRGFAGRIAAERRPIAIDDVDHADILNPLLREKGIKSLLGVPLRVEDRVVGVLHVGTLTPRAFSQEDRTLLQLVGDRVAVAIDQSKLYERERAARAAAEAAERRVRFLAEASRLLTASLDYETTLANVADLAGSTIADWVSVYLLDDDGAITRILGRHRDPDRDALVQEYAERWPPRIDDDTPTARALRTAESFLLSEISDDMLARAARDDEHLRVLRSLGLHSAVVVPIATTGRALGAIAFARERGTRAYEEEDLGLAEELGRRAALAVENARLYEAARYQSQLARTIADNAASALFMIDERGHPTYMNRAAEAMTGYRLDEISAAPLHMAVHHTRPDGTPFPLEECPIDRALPRQHRVEPYEDVFVRKDGTFFPVLAAASPIVSDGRPVGTVVEVRDITDEKRADRERRELLAREQEARREAEARAQAAQALEFVADGVLLVDCDGIVGLWNPAAAAITGVPAEAIVGRRADEAIGGWTELVERVPLARAGATPARPQTLPLEIAERELWLSVSAVAFDAGTVYAFRDVTEERGVEKLKSDFVSTVSHELRTPLAAIYGAALTLRRGDLPLPEEQQESLLAVIADEAERLARIVNDILWTSRIESGGLHITIESCDAVALTRAVVEAARVHAPGNVSIELEAADAPRVAADPDKVRMVLANLVDNAVKYSPAGGVVRVTVEGAETRVRFSVSDEGLGIPAAEQERIFEKFYRLDPNLTQGVGGTGLGLYICRELVRRMHGRIWVTSAPGRGSSFLFELPAVGDVAGHVSERRAAGR